MDAAYHVDSSSIPVLSEMPLHVCCPPLESITTGEMFVPAEHPDPVNREINEKEAEDDGSMKYVPPS